MSKVDFPSLKDLLEAGAHFGHSVKRRNPKMDDYVYAVKNGVQIFDLIKTREQLEKAADYVEEVASKGGKILILGTKGQAVEVVQEQAEKIKMPYIINRWVGGLFTNWSEIKKRVNKLEKMVEEMEKGEYKKYTKKEQVLKKREIERLTRMYGGLVGMKDLPAVLFVVDPHRESTAVKEALAVGVAVVAIVDTNSDPEGLEVVIPANDDSSKTVKMIVTSISEAIALGIKKIKKTSK